MLIGNKLYMKISTYWKNSQMFRGHLGFLSAFKSVIVV